MTKTVVAVEMEGTVSGYKKEKETHQSSLTSWLEHRRLRFTKINSSPGNFKTSLQENDVVMVTFSWHSSVLNGSCHLLYMKAGAGNCISFILSPCVQSDLIACWQPPLNQLQNAIKRHYRDAAVIKTSRCPFNIPQSIQLIRFPPVPFSLGCHQFAISHGPSGAIIDDVLEWDEGNLRFNFIGKVEGRSVSRLVHLLLVCLQRRNSDT